MVERTLLVYANWAVFGLGGLCFLMEGFARDSYFVALAGTVMILAGVIGHLIINAIWRTAFTTGEATLGVGIFALAALTFIGAWATGALSQADYWSGLTLFGLLALGLPVYLATRYGFRGAFAQIGIQARDDRGAGR